MPVKHALADRAIGRQRRARVEDADHAPGGVETWIAPQRRASDRRAAATSPRPPAAACARANGAQVDVGDHLALITRTRPPPQRARAWAMPPAGCPAGRFSTLNIGGQTPVAAPSPSAARIPVAQVMHVDDRLRETRAGACSPAETDRWVAADRHQWLGERQTERASASSGPAASSITPVSVNGTRNPAAGARPALARIIDRNMLCKWPIEDLCHWHWDTWVGRRRGFRWHGETTWVCCDPRSGQESRDSIAARFRSTSRASTSWSRTTPPRADSPSPPTSPNGVAGAE